MPLLFCRKCDKEIAEPKAIIFKDNFYCPSCKIRLSYFGQEEGEISSEEEISLYDEEFPDAIKEKPTGIRSQYTNPQVNTLILECRDALKHNPGNIEALLNLARLYRFQNDNKNAIEYYLRIIDIHPEHVDARKDLADIYLADKEFDKAQEQLDVLLENDPDNYLVYFNLGILYYQQNNLRKALKFFLSSQELCDSDKTKQNIIAYIEKISFELKQK